MKKIILVICGIVILAAGISPYFCGNLLNDKFNKEIAELQNRLKLYPDIVLKKTEYSKGWFTSYVKTELSVKGHSLLMDHKFIHGPWGYFGLGKVKTTIEINKEIKPDIEKLFADKEPLVITTKVGFGGYDAIEIYSPAIAKQSLASNPSINLTWAGMQGKLKFAGDRAISNLKIPELKIENTNTHESYVLQKISLTGEGIYFSENLDRVVNENWSGKTALAIDKLAVNNTSGNFSSVINLVVKTKDIDDGKVAYGANLKLTDLKLPADFTTLKNKSNNIESDITLTGIPKKQLVDLITFSNKLQKEGASPSQVEFSLKLLVQSLITEFLKGTPSIQYFFQINGDKENAFIKTEAKLVVPDTTNDMLSLLRKSLERLEITINPSFSESLIDEAIATGRMKMTKDEFIQTITKDNRFKFSNGQYTGNFVYKLGDSDNLQDIDLKSLLPQLKLNKFGIFY